MRLEAPLSIHHLSERASEACTSLSTDSRFKVISIQEVLAFLKLDGFGGLSSAIH